MSRSELPRVRLADHELTAEIGRGAWGVVWRAVHVPSGTVVAVKLLAQEIANDADVRRRFEREARVLARLAHPHIVGVRDVALGPGPVAIIMEHVGGGQLAGLVRAGPLPPIDAVAVCLAMCAALQHAHERGTVHRDLKPDNVLLTEDGVVKVADFGIAPIVGGLTNITAAGTLLGTPGFMAPEQILAEAPTPAVDVYAIGVTLHLLLSGALPASAAGAARPDGVAPPSPLDLLAARVNEDVEPFGRVAPDAAPAIAAVVDRALARRAEDRFSDAGQLGAALSRAAAQAFGSGGVDAARFPVRGARFPDIAGSWPPEAPAVSRSSADPQEAVVTAFRPVLRHGVVLLVSAPGVPSARVEVTGPIVVGRTEGDVVLVDAELSRRHVRLSPAAGGTVLVEDLGSSNGTFVDGQRIAGPTVLGRGGWLDVGATRIVLEAAPPNG